MIVDTLTKFNFRRKMWMTPEHPLCLKDKEFKVMYSAAVIMQAQLNTSVSALNNYELERLLKAGFKFDTSDIAYAMRSSKQNAVVVDYMIDNLVSEAERTFLMMDMINVSINGGNIDERVFDSLKLFARMFDISSDRLNLLCKFVECAYKEEIAECQNFAWIIEKQIEGIQTSDLQYYIMQLSETSEFTQKLLDEKKNFRILDRCNIYEDIVLKEGMTLVIEHAVVRIFGNILIDGGKLIIRDSKVVKKSDAHRAVVNLNSYNSIIEVQSANVDCRHCGMFIRAEEGSVFIDKSNIYNTSVGAAVRFFGKKMVVRDSVFARCYSPEDGGALMIRGGEAHVTGCRFSDCEAKRGGAVYSVEGTTISECKFRKCNVAEYGAAVFYSGFVGGNVSYLRYEDCHPSGAEIVQNISLGRVCSIKGEYKVTTSTIVDCPVEIESSAKVVVEDANIYLNYPVKCMGSLSMKNVKVVSNHIDKGDMLYIDNAKFCEIYHCEINGMMKTGGLNILGTKVSIKKTLFRNMLGGRAVYNAFNPEIEDCIFNFCQKGAIYSQGGKIERCVFINCRAKTGAGVQMYGNKGVIDKCNFRRCVSEYSGGAVDKGIGTKVTRCLFEECKPDNVS